MSNARHSSTASPQHVNSIPNKIFICNGVFSIKQYGLCHSVPLLMGYVNVCSCAIYGGTWEWGLKFANCCGEGKRRINSESAMSGVTTAARMQRGLCPLRLCKEKKHQRVVYRYSQDAYGGYSATLNREWGFMYERQLTICGRKLIQFS